MIKPSLCAETGVKADNVTMVLGMVPQINET